MFNFVKRYFRKKSVPALLIVQPLISTQEAEDECYSKDMSLAELKDAANKQLRDQAETRITPRHVGLVKVINL